MRWGRLTVAREDEELFLAVELVHQDLGVRSHNLLLGLQGEVLLELEVTNRTRQREIA